MIPRRKLWTALAAFLLLGIGVAWWSQEPKPTIAFRSFRGEGEERQAVFIMKNTSSRLIRFYGDKTDVWRIRCAVKLVDVEVGSDPVWVRGFRKVDRANPFDWKLLPGEHAKISVAVNSADEPIPPGAFQIGVEFWAEPTELSKTISRVLQAVTGRGMRPRATISWSDAVAP